MIIYRPGEKVRVQMGEVTVILTPLSRDNRMRIVDVLDRDKSGGTSSRATALFSYETLRLSVKGLEAPGYQLSDGSPVVLEFDEQGNLTDYGLELLFSVVASNKLVQVASRLLADGIGDWGIPEVELKGIVPESKSEEKKV